MTGRENEKKIERYRRVDELLDRAIALDLVSDEEGDERSQELARFLHEECGDDADLRSQLQTAIARVRDDRLTKLRRGGALSAGLLRSMRAEAPDGSPLDVRAGTRIGPYELGDRLGEGGMGVVYKAHRVDGDFEQTVAIKLLKPSSKPGLAERFTLERRILATLDHPNIARLLDGGVTPLGEPFLVVEYVDGVPIDRYCSEADLPVSERLALLADLCSAVDEAHRRLVVHRDIKPANILVTADGVPKLLDFGIAKLVEGPDLADAFVTQTDQKAMTLQYASPEQYRGLPITVESDVYQLGLVGYGILTGQRPYLVRDQTPSETERAIVHVEPPLPSAAAPVARARQLQGDIDTIIMKAIRKDPAFRYRSAMALYSDIQRHLGGHPIEARVASLQYRLRKFVGRHREAVALAAALSLLLLITSTVLSMQVFREQARTKAAALDAQRERDLAVRARTETKESLDFLVSLFGKVTPDALGGDTVSVTELLDSGRQTLSTIENGATKARLLSVLGEVYREHGRLEDSQTLQEDALRLTNELSELESTESAASRVQAARVLHQLGKIAAEGGRDADALEFYEKALIELSNAPETESRLHAEVLTSQGTSLVLNEPEQALAVANRAVAMIEKVDGPDSPASFGAKRLVGEALLRQDRFEEAKNQLNELVLRIRIAAPKSTVLVGALNALSLAENGLGNHEARVPPLEESAEIIKSLFKPGHIYRLAGFNNLAGALSAVGRYDESRRIIETVIAEAQLVGNLTYAASARESLGVLFLRTDQFAAAYDEFEDAVSLYREVLEPNDRRIVAANYNKATALLSLGRTGEAERQLQEALRGGVVSFGEGHTFLAYPLLDLTMLERERGNHAQAAGFAERGFDILDASVPIAREMRIDLLELWMEALRAQGLEDEAVALEVLRTTRRS